MEGCCDHRIYAIVQLNNCLDSKLVHVGKSHKVKIDLSQYVIQFCCLGQSLFQTLASFEDGRHADLKGGGAGL